MSERETLTDMLFRILNEVKDAEDVILVLKNGEEVQPYTNEMPYEVAAQMLGRRFAFSLEHRLWRRRGRRG